ncbi:hypothetical protein Zmor_003623 [Zophobas morio]|uniref:Uncharacterized protein n=1 Tax=Zophobas morio TaxID=2755281 RepID=A0AA38M275_9CUCU|nr:hypothetical protein Zmor_003623 [Zophobas morio]
MHGEKRGEADSWILSRLGTLLFDSSTNSKRGNRKPRPPFTVHGDGPSGALAYWEKRGEADPLILSRLATWQQLCGYNFYVRVTSNFSNCIVAITRMWPVHVLLLFTHTHISADGNGISFISPQLRFGTTLFFQRLPKKKNGRIPQSPCQLSIPTPKP